MCIDDNEFKIEIMSRSQIKNGCVMERKRREKKRCQLLLVPLNY